MKVNLDELLKAGIIDEATSIRIETYYAQKKADAPSRLLLAFGVLGAVLVGLGIILIVAHNWDFFPRYFKNFLAFLPMLLGQIICGYTLWKKRTNEIWRESSSVFLVFAIGACIATISQIYNIQGDISSFLLTWLLLGLPLIYVMNSSAVSLLYIMGVIWFTLLDGFVQEGTMPWVCWGLLALAFPQYYRLWKYRPMSNFLHLHSWALAIAGLILLGTWAGTDTKWLFIAYMSGLAIYYFIGSQLLSHRRLINDPFSLIGMAGTIGIFLFFSFISNWEDLVSNDFSLTTSFQHQEFWVALLLTVLAALGLVRHLRSSNDSPPFIIGFLLFSIVFFIGHSLPIVATIICNIFVLLVGIYYIFKGNEHNSLKLLNLGLITTAALIIARFLDIDISFVVRGILFIGIGLIFFAANYRLAQNIKNQV